MFQRVPTSILIHLINTNMANSVALAFVCLAVAGIFLRAAAIRKNAKIAESTGFKVFYSP